jgi:hypothetical protein
MILGRNTYAHSAAITGQWRQKYMALQTEFHRKVVKSLQLQKVHFGNTQLRIRKAPERTGQEKEERRKIEGKERA